MVQSVKEYFKELNSVYELCRLGIHRPALRLAPDQGFIRVPLSKFKANKLIKRVNETSTNFASSSTTTTTKATINTTSPTKKSLKPSISFTGAIPNIKKEFINSPLLSGTTPTPGVTNSTESSSTNSKIKVDEWFTKIQAHKSTRQLGLNLKSYAKILKSLGVKISEGNSSTFSTTFQSNTFPASSNNIPRSSTTASNTSDPGKNNSTDDNNIKKKLDGDQIKIENDLNKQPQPAAVKPPQQTFQSTIIPTISSINLDRTIFEEFRPSKHLSNIPVAGVIQALPSASSSSSSNTTTAPGAANISNHNSSLSSLLNQPINQTDIINLSQTDFSINHPHHSHSNAQILSNFSLIQNSSNISNSASHQHHHGQHHPHHHHHQSGIGSDQIGNSANLTSSSGVSANTLLQQQQQQTLNNLASGSNLTQIAQLTANLATPPCLVVYIIDPFDFYL
jgi:hypothetical protein